MPDLLIAQTIKSNQKLFVTRSAVELYWWLSYATYLPKVISINGLKQFSWLRRVRSIAMYQVKQKALD